MEEYIIETAPEKPREELVVTVRKTVTQDSKTSLRSINAQIAEIDKRKTEIDGQVQAFLLNDEAKRVELVTLKANIEAELPVIR